MSACAPLPHTENDITIPNPEEAGYASESATYALNGTSCDIINANAGEACYVSEHKENTLNNESMEHVEQVAHYQRAEVQVLPYGASIPTISSSGNYPYEPVKIMRTMYDIDGENHLWSLELKQSHFSEVEYAQSWFEFWLGSHTDMVGQAHHVEQFTLGDTEAFVVSRFTLEQLSNLYQPIQEGAEQTSDYADEVTIILHWVQGNDFFELRVKGQPGAFAWSDLRAIAASVR